MSTYDTPYDMDRHVANLLESMDAYGLDAVPVVGHSYGGRSSAPFGTQLGPEPSESSPSGSGCGRCDATRSRTAENPSTSSVHVAKLGHMT